jgi:hypothetical protein
MEAMPLAEDLDGYKYDRPHGVEMMKRMRNEGSKLCSFRTPLQQCYRGYKS